jgi:hypothetical protein
MSGHELAAKVALGLLMVPVAFLLVLGFAWLAARAYEAVRREYHARMIGRGGRYGSHR